MMSRYSNCRGWNVCLFQVGTYIKHWKWCFNKYREKCESETWVLFPDQQVQSRWLKGGGGREGGKGRPEGRGGNLLAQMGRFDLMLSARAADTWDRRWHWDFTRDLTGMWNWWTYSGDRTFFIPDLFFL